MMFNVIILVAIGVIVFFHYVQGFFSATLSAIIAAIAAVMALSFYEPVVEALLAGKMANTAHALVLMALFAVIYLVLRVLFDKAIPGNIRVPAIVDKVGGAAMGLVAAVFAGGVVAVAGQMLPFTAAAGGYAKYEVDERRQVAVPTQAGGRQADRILFDELRSETSGKFDEAQRQNLWVLPVDEILVNTVEHLSDDGALAAGRPLEQVHPDLLQELFGQRLGMETGSTRVVMHQPDKNKPAFSSVDLYTIPSAPQEDFESDKVRRPTRKAAVPAELRPTPAQMIVVARVMLTRQAGDPEDFWFRFSPGSVRLVAPGERPTGERAFVNYFPVGTLEKGRTVVANKPDDFLFADLRQSDKGVDFVFVVDKAGFVQDPNEKPLKVADGIFLEINRMGRIELSQLEVKTGIQPSEKVAILRKGQTATPPGVTPPGVTPPPVAGTQPTTPTPPTPNPYLAKLIGAWMGTTGDNRSLILEFKEGGELAYAVNGVPGTGTWKVTSEAGTNVIGISRNIAGNEMNATITFKSDDAISYQPSGQASMEMTRRK